MKGLGLRVWSLGSRVKGFNVMLDILVKGLGFQI